MSEQQTQQQAESTKAPEQQQETFDPDAPIDPGPWFVRDGKEYHGVDDVRPAKDAKPEAETDAKPEPTKGKAKAKAKKAEPAAKPAAEPEEKPEAEAAPEEAAKAEAKDEPEEAKPEPEEKLSEAFVSLKKQRKAIAQRERAAARAEEELARERAEHQRLRELIAKDKYAAAKELGLDFRALVEEVAKDGDEEPHVKLAKAQQRELDQVKAELAALKNERQEQAKTQALAQERQTLASRIGEMTEDYPYLNRYGADRVATAAQNAFYEQLHRTGQQPDIWSLLDQYEQELAADAERLAPSAKPVESTDSPARRNGAVQSAKTGEQLAPATLSNRTAAQRASADRPLSNEERLKEFASRLRFIEDR